MSEEKGALMGEEEFLERTGKTIGQAWEETRRSAGYAQCVKWQEDELAQMAADGEDVSEEMTPEEYADYVCDPVAAEWDKKKREEREASPEYCRMDSLGKDRSELVAHGIWVIDEELCEAINHNGALRERYGLKDGQELEPPYFAANMGMSASFENDVFSIHAYDWSEDEDGYGLNSKNFVHKATGSAVEWYKYCGRGMCANERLETLLDEEAFWETVVTPCLESIHDIEFDG